MELRHLIYFKTVAEELHFRKAAAKLFISQPPLSRQIRELEEELGARLFDRNNKRVELTPAGRYFKGKVDEMIDQLNESKLIVKQLHEHLSGELKIGYISSTYHIHLIDTLKDIRLAFPFLNIKLFEVPTVKQIEGLLDGGLDIGIMRAPVNSDKLTVHTLFEDPFVVVLPQNVNPRDLINIGAYLATQPFIFFNRDYAPAYFLKLIEICQRMAFTPQITHEANNVHSILRLVEHGAGVSILPQSIKDHYPYLKLQYLELSGLPISSEVVLAYKARPQNEAVTWFTEHYKQYFNSSN